MARQRKKGIRGGGTVFLRKDGRWEAKFKVEETGKYKSLYAATEREAYEKLQQALQEQRQGILASGPNQKLSDFLNWWLEEVHRLNIRDSSYLRYRGLLNNHILPELGQYQLKKLTTQRIQTFYNKKLKEKQSPSSVHSMQKVLHRALDYAVKGRLLSYNPSTGISLPPAKKRKAVSLTLEQAQHLLTVARGHKLEALLAVALTTGMRHGELAALRWGDIDFEKGTIYVHRTVGRLGQYGYVEGDPKTESSERTIPISQTVCNYLKAHRRQQEDARFKAGAKWTNKDLVFCNRRGDFLDPDLLLDNFYALLDKASLPRMWLHDLRHTASTLLQSMGVTPRMVQEILGHSNLEQTGDYTHVIFSMQKDAAEKMDRLFQKPL